MTSPIKVNVTLYNHDGTWSARGDYKDPITGRRVRKSKTLRLKVANSTKRKAAAMLPEVKAQWEAELNSNVVSDDPTFAESVERWLEAKSKSVKENTMVAYTGYANKHIIPMLGHIKTKDIQYAHLQRYIDDLAGDLKVKSLKKHLVVINGALEDAERSGIISSNPARLVQMPRESEKFVGNTLNEEEAKEALSAAQEEGEPMYAIVILGMVYGLRRSEMCGLRWKDIDFENGYIHVCNTVVKGKSGHIEEESTKTEKSNRYLPLIGFTIPYFRDLLQQQISSGSKCDKVCQLSDGSPVLPDYMTHKYKEFLAAHNLPDIRCMICGIQQRAYWPLMTQHLNKHRSFSVMRTYLPHWTSILTALTRASARQLT